MKKLVIDDSNMIFDPEGMHYREFPSDFDKIRDYTKEILKNAPKKLLEGNLLEQQLSEIIKNGIKHGNKCNPDKKIKIWYNLKKEARFIIEDEGAGFRDLEEWNKFYRKRQSALEKEEYEKFYSMLNFKTTQSGPEDGGNSLIAALEYWNGGIIYNKKKNKIGVLRSFNGNSNKKIS
jgi:serine/threonine-protein kinase RsbW